MTIISQTRNFCFIHIRKCGGSSIEIEWEKHLRWGDFVIGSTHHGEILQNSFSNLYGLGKHTSAQRLADILGAETYAAMHSMALVREPLKIVESEFKYAVFLWGTLLAQHLARTGNDVDAMLALEAQAREALLSRSGDVVPAWWHTHNGGTIREAILAESFEEFVERVADDRWRNYLSSQLTDADGRLMVKHVFKREDPDSILSFFRETLAMPDFQLLWENKGANTPVQWPAGMRRTYLDICAEDYERFGYTPEPA